MVCFIISHYNATYHINLNSSVSLKKKLNKVLHVFPLVMLVKGLNLDGYFFIIIMLSTSM